MKSEVDYEDFAKLDLRVGKIIEVEEIEGADKLWKLEVDLGEEIGKRTICAGLKEFYPKEKLEGKNIIMLINLAPRKMRGTESQGMLLAASTKNYEKVLLIQPEEDIELGSKIS